MGLRHAVIPMGQGSEKQILSLLAAHLDPAADDFAQQVQDLSYRVITDQNRLPWVAAVAAWFDGLDKEAQNRFLIEVQAVAKERYGAWGALYILMTFVEHKELSPEPLFWLALHHPDDDVRRSAGAYLLNGKTLEEALVRLGDDPLFAEMVEREKTGRIVIPVFRKALGRIEDPADEQKVLSLVASHYNLLGLELSEAVRQRFADLADEARRDFVGWLHGLLKHSEAAVREFADDLLCYGELKEAAIEYGFDIKGVRH